MNVKLGHRCPFPDVGSMPVKCPILWSLEKHLNHPLWSLHSWFTARYIAKYFQGECKVVRISVQLFKEL